MKETMKKIIVIDIVKEYAEDREEIAGVIKKFKKTIEILPNKKNDFNQMVANISTALDLLSNLILLKKFETHKQDLAELIPLLEEEVNNLKELVKVVK